MNKVPNVADRDHVCVSVCLRVLLSLANDSSETIKGICGVWKLIAKFGSCDVPNQNRTRTDEKNPLFFLVIGPVA